MKSTLSWHGELSFTGAADSGFPMELSGNPPRNGVVDGARPMEMMLAALGGCTGMDVISILQKKRQDVTGFEVQLEADRALDHPKVFTRIKIHFVVRGRNVSDAAVSRSIELSRNIYCPASAMLSKAVPIEYSYKIIAEPELEIV